MNTGAHSTAVLRHHAPVFLRAELMCIMRRQQSGHSIVEQEKKKLSNGDEREVALHCISPPGTKCQASSSVLVVSKIPTRLHPAS